MMHTLYIASKNNHKIRELTGMIAGKPFVIKSLNDIPDYRPPAETGKTFLENAVLKAQALWQYLKKMMGGPGQAAGGSFVLADDSGLECEDLAGAPGVYSSRFAGENATDDENNQKLVQELKNVTHLTRAAHYTCALVLIGMDGKRHEIVETCEGLITFAPKGKNGFGYDPYFYLPERDQTMAELNADQKNQISHRGKAMRKLMEVLSPCPFQEK